MKILQFAPYFPPYLGGQEQYVFNLSIALARKGHEVEVVTTSSSSGASLPGTEAIRVRYFKPLTTLIRNPIAPTIALSLREFSDSDIIHCHNEHAFTSLAAAVLRGISGIPMVLTVHGQLVFGEPILDRIERIYEASVGRMIMSRADRIAVLSKNDLSFVSRLSGEFSEKTIVSANAIDTTRIDRRKPHDSERRIADTSIFTTKNEGKHMLLFVGQMIKRKGIPTLLRAYAELPSKLRGNTVLVLVGEGPDKDEFIRVARSIDEENIIFTGYLSEQDLDALYRRADIFCLPSYSEGFPGAVLEAMYYGLPSILTNIPGVLERFRDLAVFVEPNDARQIAEAVTFLTDDGELRARMSSKGREFVMNNYTWDRIADGYIKVYQDLLDAHSE